MEPLSLDAAFRAHSAYVAYIGIRILGRGDDIDDLVQDVFAEACTGLRGLRDHAAVKAWLSTVTARIATRRLRMRKLKRLIGFDRKSADLVWPGASPEQCAAIAKVYATLETVPAKHRIAWVLRVVEGEPLEHVAAVCDCSLATAKRWVARVQAAVSGSDADEEAGT